MSDSGGDATRDALLQAGLLYDISELAKTLAQLDMPTAISHLLWEVIAPGESFRTDHDQIKQVCFAFCFARAGLLPTELSVQGSAQVLRFQCLPCHRMVTVVAVVHPLEDRSLVCTLLSGHEN